MKLMKLAFAVFLLAGISLALQWEGNYTSNEVYDGGNAIPVCSAGNPTYIRYSAAIAHMLAINATLTQNGQEPTEFVPGTANLSIRITTNASIGNVVSFSKKDDVVTSNPQPSPVGATVLFNSAEYSYISGVYDNCRTSNRVNPPPTHYLNSKYDPNTNPCNHMMNSADAVTVNLGYRSGADNNQCMTPSVNNMGKGYMYCSGGTISINGHDMGKLSSNQQTLNTSVTLNEGQSSIPVSVTYQCYFIAELYNDAGQKQEIQHQMYQMPGGVPITQTVNVPIVIIPPHFINLIPIIRINNSNGIVIDYDTSQTITTFNRNQKVNLLTWQYIGTPPEIKTSVPVVYVNQPLVPPLRGGDRPYILLIPYKEITICDDDKEFDTITVTIDPFGNIRESDPGDNTITLTINCSNKSDDNFRCSFYPTNNPIIEPGESIMTLLRCWNIITNAQVNCPTVTINMVKYYDNDFGNYFVKPVDWAEIKSNSYDSDNFNVTAIENSQPEIAYQGTVEVKMPTDSGETWKDCRFNVLWRRPDCRYYM
ncbi:MAG: hypothetical protein NTY68_02735 [Candidatus Micrarchaeota archaeon]|nr:hypothetical protein [Candidatus Micrarchaeota archaeon]